VLPADLGSAFTQIQRRFSLGTQAPTWNTLAEQIRNRFVLPDDYNLALGYLDEDGETVVMCVFARAWLLQSLPMPY
jgi:hypothetical protein